MVIRDWAKHVGVDPAKFGTHSARSGVAISAFKAGVASIGIQKLGDWLSDTFLSYVRQDISDLYGIQMQILSHLTQDQS